MICSFLKSKVGLKLPVYANSFGNILHHCCHASQILEGTIRVGPQACFLRKKKKKNKAKKNPDEIWHIERLLGKYFSSIMSTLCDSRPLLACVVTSCTCVMTLFASTKLKVWHGFKFQVRTWSTALSTTPFLPGRWQASAWRPWQTRALLVQFVRLMLKHAKLRKAVPGRLAGDVGDYGGFVGGPVVDRCWQLVDSHEDVNTYECFHFFHALLRPWGRICYWQICTEDQNHWKAHTNKLQK